MKRKNSHVPRSFEKTWKNEEKHFFWEEKPYRKKRFEEPILKQKFPENILENEKIHQSLTNYEKKIEKKRKINPFRKKKNRYEKKKLVITKNKIPMTLI